MGLTLAEWPDPSPWGFVAARVDLYPGVVDGWRVGAAPWGRLSLWPAPTWSSEEQSAVATSFFEYGLDVVLTRAEPDWIYGGRFGFSRLDLSDYEDGVLAVPMLGVELDLSRRFGAGLVGLGLRGEWGSQRSRVVAEGEPALGDEWWSLSLALHVGAVIEGK